MFCNAADEWLKPSVILAAFEARSFRMCVERAKKLGTYTNQEEGMSSQLDIVTIFYTLSPVLTQLFRQMSGALEQRMIIF